MQGATLGIIRVPLFSETPLCFGHQLPEWCSAGFEFPAKTRTAPASDSWEPQTAPDHMGASGGFLLRN